MTYGKIITTTALRYGLNPQLLAALIIHESKGCPWAIKNEPGFYKKYLQGKPIQDIPGRWPSGNIVPIERERLLRSWSFGLTQIMGQTARENGFDGDWLTSLLDPAINIEFGAKYFARCLARTHSVEAALLSYNGGGDATYPSKVLAVLNSGEFQRVLVG